MAPHCEWPSTTTRRVLKRVAANSTLPTCDGATMFPATRITNRSPTPWSNTSSAGTRESEQPSTIANGNCLSTSEARRMLNDPSTLRTSLAKRWFPSRSFSSASRAFSMMLSVVCLHHCLQVHHGLLAQANVPLVRAVKIGDKADHECERERYQQDRGRASG